MVTLMAGDVTMAVDIDCTRNHQEPHEIPISFFVDFVFFSGLEAPQGNVGLKRRILRWVEWADTPRKKQATCLAVKQWDSNAAGFFHIFCCLGQEECKYFPFTIKNWWCQERSPDSPSPGRRKWRPWWMLASWGGLRYLLVNGDDGH